jgi:hypothetical protein
MTFDFNTARNPSVVPAGTIAKVRMTIRPGGYDHPDKGWTGGYVTQGKSGTHYLNCEFTVLNGAYAEKKVLSSIGLYSPNGHQWEEMGRYFIRSILNSAHGFSDKDNSAEAQAARRIKGFSELDGLEFVVRIDVRTDDTGQERNEIRVALTPDHQDYAAHMKQQQSG